MSNADEGGLKNVEGLLFKEQEAGYLAGYAAGLAAKDRGGKAVSSVGGQKQPPVDRYIAGFQAGAKAAFPGVQTLNGYSNDFEKLALCKEVALNQIADGSVVVFQVAGGCGLGALDAAKEKSVWGVGVDADQGYLGSYVLTSALKRVDTSVFDSIKDAKDGQVQGRPGRRLRARRQRRRHREVLGEGARRHRRQGGADQAADRRREDQEHPDDREIGA